MTWRHERVRALVAAIAIAAGACAERAPEAGWPAGALLVGRAASLRAVLDDLQRLADTPLARAARHWASALPDCEVFEAHAASGRLADLPAAMRCRTTPGPLDAANDYRADRDLLLVLPGTGSGTARPLAVARVEAEQLHLSLRWPGPPADGALSLLVPGEEPAGAGQLGAAQRLVHVRVRPADGLDLAALVPEGSQGDRLFALRSELFAGAVLDGAWEAAVYLPEPDEASTRAALALEFTLRRAAVAAIEHFIGEITSRWPVRRSDFAFGAAAGACLLDLKILPDFAPCYVATERALVIGWNAASFAPALASNGESRREASDAAGRAVVDFAHVAAADAILARHLTDGSAAAAAALPWHRLVARGDREGGALLLRVDLERGAPR